MAGAAHGWNLEFTRLGGGAFSGRVEVASTSGLQICRFTMGSPLLATGSHPIGTSGIGLVLSAPHGVRSRGRAIDPLTTAPAREAGDETHFMTAGPVDMVTVGADASLFARHVRAASGFDLSALGRDWCLRTPQGTADCSERGRAMLGLLAVLASGAARSREARHRLQECALHILLENFQTDATTRVEPAPSRRRVARRAEEVLRARMDDPPSVHELCELVGTSDRTLHHAFHEAFGMVPKAYLRALRLSAAHRRLRHGLGPVTEVAADLGLFHFGRFAAEYRAMFGEAPSETLRHARGDAAAHEPAA